MLVLIHRAGQEVSGFEKMLASLPDQDPSGGQQQTAVEGLHGTLQSFCLLLKKLQAPLKATDQV